MVPADEEASPGHQPGEEHDLDDLLGAMPDPAHQPAEEHDLDDLLDDGASLEAASSSKMKKRKAAAQILNTFPPIAVSYTHLTLPTICSV